MVPVLSSRKYHMLKKSGCSCQKWLNFFSHAHPCTPFFLILYSMHFRVVVLVFIHTRSSFECDLRQEYLPWTSTFKHVYHIARAFNSLFVLVNQLCLLERLSQQNRSSSALNQKPLAANPDLHVFISLLHYFKYFFPNYFTLFNTTEKYNYSINVFSNTSEAIAFVGQLIDYMITLFHLLTLHQFIWLT